jgi:allantoinase
VTPQGVRDALVRVEHGRIVSVEDPGIRGSIGADDLGDRVLMPGLVDPHVHINDPGRADWEGFDSATRAARAGGISVVVDMPLNAIPATTSAAALRAKREAAAGRCEVAVEFWGGVVPGNVAELEPMAEAGVRGFKCFLVPSGVDEFPHVGEAELRQAMPVIARLGLPLLVHAELPEPIDRATAGLANADPRRYATWLASRPPEAEVLAVRLMMRLCEETGCRVHIVHLSAAEALPDLRAARRRGLPVTVETCPHYLCFAAEDVRDGATDLKCAPPIRDRANRERLWEALASGDIDLIASDHSPCPPALKRHDTGDFMAAWGGIASLELGLSVVWTLASERGIGIERVARWMCEAPAELAGFGGRKGAIAPGYDADLIAFDDRATWTIEAGALHQRHPVTPYAGRTVRGRVVPLK